jgi:hypothetical protein
LTKHRKWTEDEDNRLRQMYNLHIHWKVIARELKCSVFQAENRASKLKIKRKARTSHLVTLSITLPRGVYEPWRGWLEEEGVSRSRHMRILIIRELRNKGIKLDLKEVNR